MKDIKTTILGLGLAILIAVQPLTTAEGFDINKDWFQILVSIGIGAFGYFAQDSKKDAN